MRKGWLSRRCVGLGVAVAMLVAAAWPAPQARAMNRDVRTVIVGGTYGLLGGTLVGLGTLAFNGDSRSVFVGSSVGLYLGIAVGVFYALNRDDPGNPLKPRREDYSLIAPSSGRELASARGAGPLESAASARASLQGRWVVLEF